MDPIFYISSRGAAATTWLSKVLSSHPKIVAWHGTRSIPPYGSGTNDIPPDQFINGLVQCTKQCQNMKIFGAVHGYYGTLAKKAVEQVGGRFSYILRHPVLRINSIINNYVIKDENLELDNPIHHLYSSQSENVDFLDKDSVYGFYERVTQNCFIKKADDGNFQIVLPKGSPDAKYIVNLLKNFLYLTTQFIQFDLDCIENCESDQMIIMEKMVSSKEYFFDVVWSNVAPQINPTQAYMNEVFDTKPINRHSPQGLKVWENVYERWPQVFKNIFHTVAESIGLEQMKKFYESAGYPVPL